MKMKKFLMMMALMLSLVLSVNAQTAIETPKFLDNVYVGVEAGVTTPLNFNSVFPLNPVAGVKVGKELTPVFGLEVEGFTVFGDNVYRYGTNGSIPTDGSFNLHKNGSVNTFVKATNVGLNGVINWSNLLFGYQGTPRFFEVKTNTGLGWMHYFGTYTPTFPIGSYVPTGKTNVLTAKTAIDFAFNLGNKKAHTLTVSPGVYWNLNEEGGLRFDKTYAQLGVMVGYTYHFKTSNGTHHFKTYDVGAMNNEINRLQAELAKKPNVVVKEIIREKFVPAENTVWVPFAFDKAELTNDAKAILNNLKNVKTVNVDGYASWEDGSNAEHNKALSIARAHTVTEYLKSIGVNVNNSEGHGAEGITSQRCVIVSVVK